MKKFNINTLIYLLAGIIIGLSAAFITVLVLKNNNEPVNNENTQVIINDNNNKNEQVSDDNNTSNDNKVEPLEYFTSISNSTDKGTIKQGFIKVVDFLFYNEPINGVKFSELKDNAKLKLLSVALKIDSKIDSYFPGYKETLSTGVKNIYKDVKIKIVELYVKITTKICTSNPDLCTSAKEDFNSLKNSFGITFDFLKNLGSEELDKLKKWYEDFRD